MNYKVWGDILSKSMILYIPLSFATPILMYQLRDNNRMIIMDENNSYHVSEYSTDRQLYDLYEYNVRLACESFLNRNPNGFDNPKLFNSMFVDKAQENGMTHFKGEYEQFRDLKIHQKCEIVSIKIIRADKRRSYAEVSGQLIRTYVSDKNQERAFTVDFKANLELIVNPDLGKNGRFAFLVTEMMYKQTKN